MIRENLLPKKLYASTWIRHLIRQISTYIAYCSLTIIFVNKVILQGKRQLENISIHITFRTAHL
jgi:hypothetical protein